jgi:hypothetical protein
VEDFKVEPTVAQVEAPTPVDIVAPEIGDHECDYANAVTRRVMGGRAIQPYELSSLNRQVAEIHADGTCPPTHIDGGPTTAWADLQDQLKT